MKYDYTIKKSAIIAAKSARELQTSLARKNYFEQHGENLPANSPQATNEFALMEWQNGTVEKFALPLGKLATWARLLTPPGGLKAELDPEINVQIEAGKIRFDYRGQSQISFCTFADQVPGAGRKRESMEVADIGEPIRLVAPVRGGEFVCEFDAAKAAQLASVKKLNRAAKVDKKAADNFARAKREERDALEKLRSAAKAHAENSKILAEDLVQVLKTQKMNLDARRALRRALAAPDICPPWMPEMRVHEVVETVYLLRDGKPYMNEFWDYEARKMQNEIAGYEYTGSKFPSERMALYSHWFATEDIDTEVETDCRAEFAELVAKLNEARAELAEYKPRKVSAKPVYVSHRRGYQTPKLKQDKLADAVKYAEGECRAFIRDRFCEIAERAGLADGIGSMWFSVGSLTKYTRARIAWRKWPKIKAELAARYLAAIQNTKHAKAQMMPVETVQNS